MITNNFIVQLKDGRYLEEMPRFSNNYRLTFYKERAKRMKYKKASNIVANSNGARIIEVKE